MTTVGYILIAAVLLTAGTVVAWNRWRIRRLLKRMDDMLGKAIDEGFTEEDYDESLLSAVEAKLARYLASSTVSARNLQAEKDKIKTLIADISHQTKTPLANVLLYAQLLSEQPLPQGSRTCITALEGQAEKLRSLIEALVKTSRLESGVLALHPQPALLAPMLEDAVAQFKPKATEKSITLALVSSEGDGVFDPKWTAEAVCNLLDNAVKYTPPEAPLPSGPTATSCSAASTSPTPAPASRRRNRPRCFSGSTAAPPIIKPREWASGCIWPGRLPRAREATSRCFPSREGVRSSRCICPEAEIFQNC